MAVHTADISEVEHLLWQVGAVAQGSPEQGLVVLTSLARKESARELFLRKGHLELSVCPNLPLRAASQIVYLLVFSEGRFGEAPEAGQQVCSGGSSSPVSDITTRPPHQGKDSDKPNVPPLLLFQLILRTDEDHGQEWATTPGQKKAKDFSQGVSELLVLGCFFLLQKGTISLFCKLKEKDGENKYLYTSINILNRPAT